MFRVNRGNYLNFFFFNFHPFTRFLSRARRRAHRIFADRAGSGGRCPFRGTLFIVHRPIRLGTGSASWSTASALSLVATTVREVRKSSPPPPPLLISRRSGITAHASCGDRSREVNYSTNAARDVYASEMPVYKWTANRDFRIAGGAERVTG